MRLMIGSFRYQYTHTQLAILPESKYLAKTVSLQVTIFFYNLRSHTSTIYCRASTTLGKSVTLSKIYIMAGSKARKGTKLSAKKSTGNKQSTGSKKTDKKQDYK
jgi:hypothetical protein